MKDVDFTIETVEIQPTNLNNNNVESGCWGDTGSGRYC